MNTNILGAKTSEICRKCMVTVLASGTFSGESCWGLLQSRSRGIPVTPWLVVVSLLFFLIPSQFSTSHFCWSLGGVKLKRILRIVTWKAGEADFSLLFSERGILSSYEVPSRCWAVLPWGMGCHRQIELFILPFLWLFTNYLFRCVNGVS